MVDLPVLNGYCTIQLYRKIGGSNRYPHTIVWDVCGNTLVDQGNFDVLDQYRWLMHWSPGTRSYYAARSGRFLNGKRVHIYMAREILGLPPGQGTSGDIPDHRNHDTLDNTLYNLRVATQSQSSANRMFYSAPCRFKGVRPRGLGFMAHIKHNGQQVWFSTMKLEIEAGLMYFYAATLLHKDFCHTDEFPEDEMPSDERQEELWQTVLKKLREEGFLV